MGSRCQAANYQGFFTGHDPTLRVSGSEVLSRGLSQVGSGGVRNLTGQVKSGQEVFGLTGRVKSGQQVFISHGRDGSPGLDPTRPDPTRPDPTRPDPTRPDPTRPDPIRPDPTRPDPIPPDPTPPDPTRPDPRGVIWPEMPC